jgi:hypothetical protein
MIRRLPSLLALAALAGCANANVIEWTDYRPAYRPSQVGLASTEPVLIETVAEPCGDAGAIAGSFNGANPGPPLTFAAVRPADARYAYRLRLACAPARDGATRMRAAFLVSDTRLTEAQGLVPPGAQPGDPAYRRFAYQMLAALMPYHDPTIADE